MKIPKEYLELPVTDIGHAMREIKAYRHVIDMIELEKTKKKLAILKKK